MNSMIWIAFEAWKLRVGMMKAYVDTEYARCELFCTEFIRCHGER